LFAVTNSVGIIILLSNTHFNTPLSAPALFSGAAGQYRPEILFLPPPCCIILFGAAGARLHFVIFPARRADGFSTAFFSTLRRYLFIGFTSSYHSVHVVFGPVSPHGGQVFDLFSPPLVDNPVENVKNPSSVHPPSQSLLNKGRRGHPPRAQQFCILCVIITQIFFPKTYRRASAQAQKE